MSRRKKKIESKKQQEKEMTREQGRARKHEESKNEE